MRSMLTLRIVLCLTLLALVPLATSSQALAGKPSSAPAAASQTSTPVFYVPLNRAELINTNTDMGEVIITDPEVADVYVHGKRRVSVIGKQIGQTTLRIFDGQRNMIRSVDVYVTYDLPAVRKALREFLPNEKIGVSMVNMRMALTGDVSSAESAATAMDIAEQFVNNKLGADDLKSRPVRDPASEQSPVLNMMRVSAGQQVMLRIRIGEIQRTALKNLGVNVTGQGNNNFLIGTGTGQFGDRSGTNPAFGYRQFFGTTSSSSFGLIQGAGSIGALDLAVQIDALERDGLLKTLAEPNLTALSGEEAQFLAGGEFPIPVPQELGTTTIEYKPFGVALKFTPYVLAPNRLRIKVQPEVSAVSNERAINVNGGISAPSFSTRRASTTVELAPGESFMLAGLLQDGMTSTINQLPGAGNIPILGALFRSSDFQRSQTELVIAVTPYLVDPSRSDDIKLPTDDFRPASFTQSIFFGALGAHQGGSVEGPAGFMTD